MSAVARGTIRNPPHENENKPLALNINNKPPIPTDLDLKTEPRVFGWIKILQLYPKVLAHDPFLVNVRLLLISTAYDSHR
jgi:hypothetical protein